MKEKNVIFYESKKKVLGRALCIAMALVFLSNCANRGYTLSEQIPLRDENLQLRKDLVKVSSNTYVTTSAFEAYEKKMELQRRELSSVSLDQEIKNYNKISNTSAPSESALLIYY